MKHRFEVLDIFRGIFASMVVFFHMSGIPNTDFSHVPVLGNEFVHNSDLFVDFFFVLSGFVITYTAQSMSRPADMQLFYKKRLFRLYPLHFIMLLVFVLMEVGKHALAAHIQVNQLNNTNNSATTFFSNLFLLNSVKLPGVTDFSWNIPSWSISAEMVSYILFGIVVWLIHRARIYRARNIVYGVIVVLALALLYMAAGDGELTYKSFAFGFLRAWIGFFLGAICLNTFNGTRDRVITAPAALFSILEIFIIAAMIVMVYDGKALKPYGYVYEILFFIAIYVFAFEKGVVSNLLKRVRLLKKIGTYSYSIYMIHAFFLSIFNIVFMRILKMPSTSYNYMFIVNYIIIYLASSWTYKHIELKFQYKKKKVLTAV